MKSYGSALVENVILHDYLKVKNSLQDLDYSRIVLTGEQYEEECTLLTCPQFGFLFLP